ncbi:hypothetical protein [Streptomyces sp. CAS3]
MITLPLTPERRTVYWTVAVCEKYGSVHRSTGLHSTSAVRHQYDFWAPKPSTSRIGLTEHTLIQARTVIAFEDLPVTGDATALPELPDGAYEVKRFFRFARTLEAGSLTGFGPSVLRTGDEVRSFYEWTAKHDQAVHVDISTLRVLDTTLTHYTRELQLTDLPDDDTTALVGQLETEGLRWIPVHQNTGTHLRVPLADGSAISISGTTPDGREAGSQHTGDARAQWLAVRDDFHDSSVEVYRSRQDLTRASDTAALAAAVLKCAREHGGGPVLNDTPQKPQSGEPAQGS